MKRRLILGYILLALSSCAKKPAEQVAEAPAIPVQTGFVVQRDVPLFFEMIGSLKAAHTVVIKPQITGLIKKIHFTEGEHVEEGALLYTLEGDAYAIRIEEIKAQRDQNLVHLQNCKKKWERYQSLTKQDVIAQVEWDELETKIALYQAMLKADEARLASARLDWEHCAIKAPVAGFAGKSLLSYGNRATLGEPLVTLTQTDPLYVDFSITEKELSHITGSSLPIDIFTLGSEEVLASGQVIFMDHAIDLKTGMLSATAKLTRQNKPLWPGQSVRVRLNYGKQEKALLVPLRAIRNNQNGPYLYIVKDDNTVELCTVSLGLEEKGDVIIEKGVEEAKKIVIEGHLRLSAGAKVQEMR